MSLVSRIQNRLLDQSASSFNLIQVKSFNIINKMRSDEWSSGLKVDFVRDAVLVVVVVVAAAVTEALSRTAASSCPSNRRDSDLSHKKYY